MVGLEVYMPTTDKNTEPSVLALLDEAKATFTERRERHGRADVTFGEVMAVLFPDGIELNTAADHRIHQMLTHVVGKLVRFTNSGLRHKDSAHDIVTYAALMESMVDSHQVIVGA